ncbi:DUF4422 domain-containing protein [Pseudobutyrivibrio xylanivorans]|uniref:DUF4422 domain-containing protein n=1 Tax=Pseudobutyrivibrio xylanivorans DSM 14809 TaxID=1123012 RepID=A0A1M6I2L0_PSEXY|nr:DUF4422 domain-containing protein [Pseudobutyrivibrio xylanivorans]SHJ28474.1 protein of unknown function [Pseudobutyrivibrio xylanivorans DSM 14809]
MDIKIFIATHKPCQLPEQSCYIPIQVGAQGKDPISYSQVGISDKTGNITRDDEGENISQKNPFYCELTATYYIWKNITADVVGLCHYRRYFASKKNLGTDTAPFENVLTEAEIERLMAESDVIIPKRNKYFIETLYSHYAHTMDGMHLDVAREVMAQVCPEDLKYMDAIFSRTNGSMYNMCIMKKDIFDQYSQWLFALLAGVEERVDLTGLTDFQARLFGRVSEILMNVWILKIQSEGKVVTEVTAAYSEKINWIKKGYWFLQAKFFGKKYTKSA